MNVFNIENEITYYLLGVFMSDGCVVNNKSDRKVYLLSKDEDWLINIKNVLFNKNKLLRRSKGYPLLVIYSKDLVDWCIKNKCTPRKSLTLEMPLVPDKYLPDFVRGYLDGDGCVTISKYSKKIKNKEYFYPKFSSVICSGSEKFIFGLNDRLCKLGFNPSVHNVKLREEPYELNGKFIIAKNPHWKLSFGDQSAIDFVNWTHYNDDVFCMSRKFNKIKMAREIYSKRPGLKYNKKKNNS